MRCTSFGGRALDISLTGPNGMVTTEPITQTGALQRMGGDTFSATTDTITGGSDGDTYSCTASNGVSTDPTDDVILRGDILCTCITDQIIMKLKVPKSLCLTNAGRYDLNTQCRQ